MPPPTFPLLEKLPSDFLKSVQSATCQDFTVDALVKASRPLFQVLVMIDNGYGLTIAFDMICIGYSMDELGLENDHGMLGVDMQSSGSRQRYYIGLSHFTGHKAFSG